MSEPVPDRESSEPTATQMPAAAGSKPRWAGPLAIAAAVVFVVVLVVLHLTGAIGPGVH